MKQDYKNEMYMYYYTIPLDMVWTPSLTILAFEQRRAGAELDKFASYIISIYFSSYHVKKLNAIS